MSRNKNFSTCLYSKSEYYSPGLVCVSRCQIVQIRPDYAGSGNILDTLLYQLFTLATSHQTKLNEHELPKIVTEEKPKERLGF